MFMQAFRVIDKKKVGTIPIKALRTILENLGHDVSNEQFYLITADADVESSGTLDFQEYMSVWPVPNDSKYSNALQTSCTCSFVKGYSMLHPKIAFEARSSCANCGIKVCSRWYSVSLLKSVLNQFFIWIFSSYTSECAHSFLLCKVY